MNRVILIVLDSVGIGALPDAAAFKDAGANTLGNIASRIPGFRLPNLEALGLGNIGPESGLPPHPTPKAAFGKADEASPGKDTTTGHWEIGGLILETSFPFFSEGFPPEIMEPFEAQIGTKTLGNVPASGTVIINELGDEHVRTGYPIVYTSADSVFQIAMHEAVIPVERQYEICQIARDLLRGPYEVGRVIARPFLGENGDYHRTSNRKDFSISPPGKTVLRLAMEAGLEVSGVGKIIDIYANDGITRHVKTKNNMEGVDRTLEYMAEQPEGLIMTNLVDFDMLFGHRRNVAGYGNALEEFDARVPELEAALRPDDILIITADHGNDPTHHGTDHTREYVPILAWGDSIQAGAQLGIRKTFADIGATIAEILNLPPTQDGTSFLNEILKPTPVES